MAMFCKMCGEELDPEEENEGICDSCKASQSHDYERDEDDYDPGVT